ncbi:hypothetical protein ONS96_007432 [Cadophora gregata f. sp. sojae]|nr:hypothetical protein ONS96_007432 [Cadophora gregata f. sp. sojae]
MEPDQRKKDTPVQVNLVTVETEMPDHTEEPVIQDAPLVGSVDISSPAPQEETVVPQTEPMLGTLGIEIPITIPISLENSNEENSNKEDGSSPNIDLSRVNGDINPPRNRTPLPNGKETNNEEKSSNSPEKIGKTEPDQTTVAKKVVAAILQREPRVLRGNRTQTRKAAEALEANTDMRAVPKTKRKPKRKASMADKLPMTKVEAP